MGGGTRCLLGGEGRKDQIRGKKNFYVYQVVDQPPEGGLLANVLLSAMRRYIRTPCMSGGEGKEEQGVGRGDPMVPIYRYLICKSSHRGRKTVVRTTPQHGQVVHAIPKIPS